MGEVVYAPIVTTLPVPVERILDQARDANLKEAIVIGLNEDGNFYFGSSTPDGGDVLWLMAIAKKKLLEIMDG